MARDIKALVQAAKMGDGYACTELYEATIQKMTGLAISIVKDEDNALDILQDSYLAAFKSLDNLEQPEKFPGWLGSIVANRCKNFLTRTKSLKLEVSLTDEEGGEFDKEDEDIIFRPEESVDYGETKRLIKEIIDGLPDEQRACVLLHYFQDMKVAEIAKLLGVSENTVKSRLLYSKKKIKSEVEELERKGTKLYAVPVFPFLRWMLDANAQSLAAASSDAMLAGIMGNLGAASAGGAAASTAAAAAEGAASVSAPAASTASAASAASTAGTAAKGAMGGAAAAKGALLGGLNAKVAAGVLAAAVAVGGGVAIGMSAAPGEAPPAASGEPALEPGEGYVFRERLTDPNSGLDPSEYYLEIAISEPAVVREYNPQTQEIYITVPARENFTIDYRPSFDDGNAEQGPFSMKDEPLDFWTLEEKEEGDGFDWGISIQRATTIDGVTVTKSKGPIAIVSESGGAGDSGAGLSQTAFMTRQNAVYFGGLWQAEQDGEAAVISPKIYVYGTVKENNPLSFRMDMPSEVNPEKFTMDICVTEPARVTNIDMEQQRIYVTAYVGDVFDLGRTVNVVRTIPTLEELKQKYITGNTSNRLPEEIMDKMGYYMVFDWVDGSYDDYEFPSKPKPPNLRTVGSDYVRPTDREYSNVIELISLDGGSVSQIHAIGPGVVTRFYNYGRTANVDEPEVKAEEFSFGTHFEITILPREEAGQSPISVA